MAHAPGNDAPRWDVVDADTPDPPEGKPSRVPKHILRDHGFDKRRSEVNLSDSSEDDGKDVVSEPKERIDTWTDAPIPWTPFAHVHLDDAGLPLDIAAKHRWNETTAANPRVIRRVPGARDLQHFPWVTEHERHDVTLSTILRHPMTLGDDAAFPEPAPRVFSFTRRNDPSRAQIFQTTFVRRDDTCRDRDTKGGSFAMAFAKQLRARHFTCGARRPSEARRYALHTAMPIREDGSVDTKTKRTLFHTVFELNHRPREGATTLWEMVQAAFEAERSYLVYESHLQDHAHLFQTGTDAPQTPYIFPRAVALRSATWDDAAVGFHVSLATQTQTETQTETETETGGGRWMDWLRDAVWTDHGLPRQDGNPWRRVRVRVPSASATSAASAGKDRVPRTARPLVNTMWSRVRPEELLVYEPDLILKDGKPTPHNYLDLWLAVGPNKLRDALDEVLPPTQEPSAEVRETTLAMGPGKASGARGAAPTMLARVVSALFVPLMQHGMAYSVQTTLANDPTWRREYERYVPHRLELAMAPDAMTMDEPVDDSSSDAGSDFDAKLDAYDRKTRKHDERPLKGENKFWSHVATLAVTKQGTLKVDGTYARERLAQAIAYLDPEQHLFDTRRIALVLRPDLPGGMPELMSFLKRVRRAGKGTPEYMRYFVDTFDVGATLAFLFHRIVIQ